MNLLVDDSLRANPLAGSSGRVKLDSDKSKLWKNLFDFFFFFHNLAFWQVGEKIKAKTAIVKKYSHIEYTIIYNFVWKCSPGYEIKLVRICIDLYP
jgi:hypothetical protein